MRWRLRAVEPRRTRRPSPYIIKLRRGTAEECAIANPVLARNEALVTSDTKGMKVGDGTTPWLELAWTLEPDYAAQRPWITEGLSLWNIR